MDSGLNAFNPQTGIFRQYIHEPENPNSLSHNGVASIYKDKIGRLWIGTLGGGLNQFDRQSQQFVHYHKKDGLPSDTIYGILEDAQGYLWLSTNQGLSRFDPRTQAFRNYEESDGLQGNQFTLNAAYKSPSGEMFFGGIYGVNAFYPEQIKDNPHIPPLVLTRVRVANNPVPIADNSLLRQSVDITKHLNLSYKDRVFSFEFAALNYRSPQKNQYAFMLEGFDQDWRYVGNNRQLAVYTNIHPGEYIFRVIGSNNDGVWNRKGASVRVTVTPPWWQSIWFKCIALALFAGVLFALYRWRINRMNSRSQAELKAERHRNELARLTRSAAMGELAAALAHEINQPLTAILNNTRAGQRFLSADCPDLQEVREILEDIAEDDMRANEVIRHLRSLFRKGELNRAFLDMNELIRQVLFLVKDEAVEKNVMIAFTPDINLSPVWVDRVNLQQVILNLILNGLESMTEQSGSGRLLISTLMQDGQTLKVIVQDSGTGIDSENIERIFDPFFTTKKEGLGMGLSICRTIIEAHGGRLWAENNPNQVAISPSSS